MIIIPAIDIKSGKCVRLTQGKFDEVVVYSDDPVEVARKFEREGAKFIHVVDLDGAKSGKVVNSGIIKKIANSVSIPIEMGGGIRNNEDIGRLLDAGVARVVIGTVALENRILLEELLDEFGEKIIAALDTKRGKLVKKGWQEESDSELVKTALEMERAGVKRFIYTDVVSDGMLTQPNFKEIKKLVDKVEVPVIAGGGVTRMEDIRKLKELGVEGVIIGKAIYEGRLTLREALEREQS